jgi:TonB family protein
MAAFYPDDVRQANISGRVLIRLWIGADGCMQRAEVIHSSGVPELDDEALQLPQYMSFLPQIEHGRAIAVQTTMPVNFELLNDTRAAAATEARIGESARDYTKRGSDMLDHGQYDLAIAQFDLAIAKDPNLAMAYADRGMAHAWRRDRDRANQDFDKAFSIDARNWVALHGRGMLAFQAGNYVEAKALFTRAIEIRASDSFALWWRAQAHLSTGDLQNVLADADSMIQLTPVEFRGYPLKALVFRLQGKPDEALAVAERLFSANPWQARACSAAAEIYAAAGKQSEALQAMDQSLRMEASAQGYLTRASYRDKTDVAGSRADIDFALQHDPQSAAAVLALARLQTDAGAFKDAEGTLQAALAKNSGQVDVVLARGIVYARSHQSELAEKDFASVRAAAMNGTAHNHLCWSLATAGVALTEALSECDAALAASPKEAIFLDSRGFVLLRLGRYQEAIGSYDGALARRPTLAMSLYGRGLAKRGAGEATAAEADLRAAMTIDASVRRRFADFGL